MPRKALNLNDRQIGYLTVIQIVGQTDRGVGIWECECVCENICRVAQNNLTRKKRPQQSCGCKRKKNKNELRTTPAI